MILDNIIIFLNVLEQFAIRVTIFDVTVEDIIKYVNKLYFNNYDMDDKMIDDIVKNTPKEFLEMHPSVIAYEERLKVEKRIDNLDNLLLEHCKKLDYHRDKFMRFIF